MISVKIKTTGWSTRWVTHLWFEWSSTVVSLSAVRWRPDAAEHRRTRSASLLWFLVQWYSLTSCERLASSLSYSHGCLSVEPPTPRTSLHLGPQRQPHRPVNLAAHPVSSSQQPKRNPSPRPPALSWTCHWEIRSRAAAWGARNMEGE